jgi:hypothetical protein
MEIGYNTFDSQEFSNPQGNNKELVARQMALQNKQNGFMNEIAR